MSTDAGYIYITDWDHFQHYGNRRPTWIKLYIDLLDNDAYTDLPLSTRAVLHGLWMVAGRSGNGRTKASLRSLSGQLGVRLRSRDGHIERLTQAGLIEVRASKALATRYQAASPELEGSKEPKKEKKNAREDAAANGVPQRSEKDMKRILEEAIAGGYRPGYLDTDPDFDPYPDVK